MLKQMNMFAPETCSEQHNCREQEQTTRWKIILQQEVTVLQLGWDEPKLHYLIVVYMITLPVAHTVRRQSAMAWRGRGRARLKCYPEMS
jgi:hypothetical protein